MGVRKTGSIHRDSGIEIPEAWMPTIKKHNNRRAVRQQTAKRAYHWVKQQGSKCTNQSCWKTTNHSRASCFIRSHMTSRPHRLKKTSSMQLKHHHLHHMWLHYETNKKLSFYCYSPQWITTAFFLRRICLTIEASLDGDHFLNSHYLNGWLSSITVGRN